MAPYSSGPGISPLRSVTHQLSTTPPPQLPQRIAHLISAVQSSAQSLAAPESSVSSKEASEAAVIVHKYKTQLSCLLYGKVPQGRWVAVVLIKTTVEVGGWEVLRGCDGWVRGMVALLERPDPPSTKIITIISLTRIFLLSRSYPTLLRETTTPALSTFITAGLNLITTAAPADGSKRRIDLTSPHLESVLDAFGHLLPRHPSLFRPCATELRILLPLLLAPTPSMTQAGTTFAPIQVTEPVLTSARRLYVLLHHCAPKNTSSEEWKKTLQQLLGSLHATTTRVFRAVIEDWEPAEGQPRQNADISTFGETVGESENAMMLPGWSGIVAGIERIVGLLALLQQYLLLPTAASVASPVGSVLDLITRLMSLTVPSDRSGASWQSGVRTNPQIGKDEREALWVGLPQIHTAVLETLSTAVDRLQHAVSPVILSSLDQLVWVFDAEDWVSDLRTSTYVLLAKYLLLAGPFISRASVSSLGRIINRCCDDLLPLMSTSAGPSPRFLPARGPQKNGSKPSSNTDALLASLSKLPEPSNASHNQSPLQSAASALLSVLISRLPPRHLKFSLRAQLDRTAVLTGNKQAMLASVLQAPETKTGGKELSSVFPHLARAFGGELEVEGLLRPRMPVLRGRKLLEKDDEDMEEEILDPEMPVDNLEAKPNGAMLDHAESEAALQPKPFVDEPDDPGQDQVPSRTSVPSHPPARANAEAANPLKRSFDTSTALASEDAHRYTPELGTGGVRVDAVSPKRPKMDAPSAPQMRPVQTRQEPSPAPLSRLDSVANARQAGHVGDDDGDDDDDDDDHFEIPPLNMEPDTEDEDDDGDEQGED